jgi:hypothetical protein
MQLKNKFIGYSTFAAFSLATGIYGVSKYYLSNQEFAKWNADAVTCYDNLSDNYFELVMDQETQAVALNWYAHWDPHAQIKLRTGYFQSNGSVSWLDSCYTFLKHENLAECISFITYDSRAAQLTAIDVNAMNENADRVRQVGIGIIEAVTYSCDNPNSEALLKRIQ